MNDLKEKVKEKDLENFKRYCKEINAEWLTIGAYLYMKKSLEDAKNKEKYIEYSKIALMELELRGICTKKLLDNQRKYIGVDHG